MELSRKEFDLLVLLEENRGKHISQRQLGQLAQISVATVNKLLAKLAQNGMADKDGITQLGLNALEPYRVKRAIFFAAGFGSRLVPVTLNTPKPLLRVKGTRMIDTLLDAVLEMGMVVVVNRKETAEIVIIHFTNCLLYTSRFSFTAA